MGCRWLAACRPRLSARNQPCRPGRRWRAARSHWSSCRSRPRLSTESGLGSSFGPRSSPWSGRLLPDTTVSLLGRKWSGFWAKWWTKRSRFFTVWININIILVYWLDDPVVATVIDCVVHSSKEYVIKKTEICNDIHQSLHVQDISW